MTDFANGLDPGREAALPSPPGAYRYAENFMLAGYDASCGIGLWLHLGTCPDDFGLWGELTIGDRHFSIDTTGVRDHSRGQRGHDHSKWGGHNLWTAAFPSGRAFGMQRMWTPQQQISLNVGFVYLDGQFHHVDVIGEPCLLADHRVAGDELTLHLRSPLGEHHLTGTTVSTIFVNLESPYGLSVGYDPQAGFGTFAPGFSRCEWDGEVAYGLTERSGE